MNIINQIKTFIEEKISLIRTEIEKNRNSKKAILNERINDKKTKIKIIKDDLIKYLKVDYLLIDSNIWMSYDAKELIDFILKFLIQSRLVIEMPNVQFDEIINLKNLPFDNPKSKKARTALHRIEEFQKAKCLEIVPLELDSKKGAYADPEIIRIILKMNENVKTMTFVSNDRELRIRIRQFTNHLQNNCNIISGEEITNLKLILDELQKELDILEKAVSKFN